MTLLPKLELALSFGLTVQCADVTLPVLLA